MKIVVLDGYTLNPGDLDWNDLAALGDLTVHDRTPAGKIVERINDAEAVFTNKTPLTRETFDTVKRVRFLGVLATGYNVVDTQAAKEKGIVVCNVPTYATVAVAQYTFALLLELCHHVGEHDRAVKQGAWTAGPDFCFWNFPLIELAGKTIGIIGFGRIGRETARIAIAFGMKVLAHDPAPPKTESDIARFVPLEELFRQADFISLHCPLLPATQGIINKNTIAKMKNGVMIINTSRGPLIVEEDLAAALHTGKVGAAAVDVVSSEPIKKDNPLLTAPNCIITPHIAWAPREARIRLMKVAVDNLRQFLAGTPVNVVNR